MNDLRDRIAAAIYEHNNPGFRWAAAHPDDRIGYGGDADAVLAVLPAPVDRAAVLRELADDQERTAATDVIRRRRSIATGRRRFAVELRRMADEAQQPEPEECNGICLYAADIGVPEAGHVVAYAHPDCPQHGGAQQPEEAGR